jgi:hypothetical protein
LIHSTFPTMMHPLPAAEPPGVRHGLGYQAHGRAVGRIGSPALHRQVRRRLSQRPDHSQVRLQRHDRVDRRGSGVLDRYGDAGASAVPQGRRRRPASGQAAGPAGPGHAAVRRADAPSRAGQSADPGVRLLDLVGGAAGGAPGQDHGHPLQHRPTPPPAAPPPVLGAASQTHDEGQARRGGIRERQGRADRLKKKR